MALEILTHRRPVAALAFVTKCAFANSARMGHLVFRNVTLQETISGSCGFSNACHSSPSDLRG